MSSTSDPPPPPTIPIDPLSCSLLGPIALLVQGLMLLLVGGSLVAKRHLEKNKRPWRIWMMDVGKQGIGQMAVHGSNLLISDQVASHGGDNPCSLYFLNILIDTTLGVAIIWVALKGLTYLFVEVLQKEGFVSGEYGHPPRLRYFLSQTSLYLLSLLILKLSVLFLFLLLLDPYLLQFADWALKWLAGSIAGQEAFVLMGFPLLMNIVQFCLIDSLIKKSPTSTLLPKHSHSTPSLSLPSFSPTSAHAPLLPTSPPSPSHRRHASARSTATRTLSPIPSSPLLFPKDDEEDYGSCSGGTSPLVSRRGSAKRRDTDEIDREELTPTPTGLFETSSVIQEVSRILASDSGGTFSRPASEKGRRRISSEEESGARRSLSREGGRRTGWDEEVGGLGLEERK